MVLATSFNGLFLERREAAYDVARVQGLAGPTDASLRPARFHAKLCTFFLCPIISFAI
jgi:hypothetical protein